MSELMQTQLQHQPKTDSSSPRPICAPRPFVRSQGPQTIPPIVGEVLRSPGRPLDSETRTFMESRLGHDFERVRVHTDRRAEESALAMDASAYTVGQHLVFGPGQYAPWTGDGRRLLTHELTHVIQQGMCLVPGSARPNPAAEQEAQAAAVRIMTDQPSVPIRRWSILPALQKTNGGETSTSPLTIPKEGIEMPWVGKGRPSSDLGYLRDSNYFWREYAKRWPEQLSPENQKRIGKELPIVDETWIKYHPEHSAYKNQRIEHHHLGQGSRAVPQPEKLHDAYTVFHPQRQVVAEGNKPIKPLKPLPTAKRTEKEISRHIREGRLPPGTPTEAPKISPSSALAGVPEEELRPPKSATGKPTSTSVPAARSTGQKQLRSAAGSASFSEEPRIRPAENAPKAMGSATQSSPVKGAAYSLGAGVARELLTSWLHDRILESVHNMPRPTIQKGSIWKKEGMEKRTPLDLIASNLPAVLEEFASARLNTTLQVLAFWQRLDTTPQMVDKKNLVAGFRKALSEDRLQLVQARTNIAKALELEQEMQEAIQAAESLIKIVESGPGIYLQFYSGLSIEEISQISSNLRWFRSSYRITLESLHQLKTAVNDQIRSDDIIFRQLEEVERNGFVLKSAYR